MRDPLAEHPVVDIGVRVHVHDPHRAVLALQRAQYRQGDRMVAAERQRLAIRGQNLVVAGLDDLDRFFQVEGVDRDIAEIGHL